MASKYGSVIGYIETRAVYDGEFGSGYRVSMYKVAGSDKLAYILYAAADDVGMTNHRAARKRKQILDYLASVNVDKCKADLTYVADLVSHQLTVPEYVVTYAVRSLYVPSAYLAKLKS
jgi:hypothetical protein